MDEELAWETLGAETAYACPGFDVVCEDVRFPDGTEGEFDYVQHGESVIVLPFTADGDVVVIEEWRQAVGRVNRGLPAGSVEDEDGDLMAAARRELREETGYEATEMSPLCSAEPTNGIANSVHHHFVARGCTPTAETDLDFNESIRIGTEEYDAILAAALDGRLHDGRAMLALAQYELRRGVDPEP